MKTALSTTLQRILKDTAREIEEDKSRYSLKRIKQMMRDASPVLSMSDALASGQALIAEIKERSPSQGKMLPQNFTEAPHAYKKSRLVKGISVLTSRTHFGPNMRVETLRKIKELTSKPVLRKDFIIEEYQVYQARAFGADAILLMANILQRDEIRRLSNLAFELGMDVLFETHCRKELDDIPETAKIIGINCRMSFDKSISLSRFLRQWLIGVEHDPSVNISRFDYAHELPANLIKVAESGVTPKNCEKILSMGFSAALVGTSLLLDKRGVTEALKDFESAFHGIKPVSERAITALHPATA